MAQISNLHFKSETQYILDICKDYWNYDPQSSKYLLSAKEIADKYNKTVPQITIIASANSSITFYCQKCKNQIKTYDKRGDFKLENIFIDGKCFCFQCQKSYTINKSVENRDEMLSRLGIAILNQAWKKLDLDELRLLVILSKCKTKQEVVNQVFMGRLQGSKESQEIWSKINLLDEMGLIWVERTEDKKIIDYHVSGKLKEILEEEFPDFYKVDNLDYYDKLQIMLQKTPIITSQNQPNYSGFFNLKNEVTLKADLEYSYSAWLNDDGTIFFRIEPSKSKKV